MDYKKRQRPTPKINLQHIENFEWPNLPPELIVLIMQRIGWYDVLTNVKRVCKHWYVLSKDPSIWRVIEFRRDVLTTKLREDMEILSFEEYVSQVLLLRKDRFDYSDYCEYEAKETALHEIVMHVIDLSCGQLQDLCFQNFGCDNLFKYIYQRSRQLRRLRLLECYVCCDDYEFDYDGWIVDYYFKMDDSDVNESSIIGGTRTSRH
ncbi:hypothetical protein POM88_053856 [Heracleum sosnowskyi]|uniref:F-box domain-containing protein n=1 Tax=Heracleum sosnowskyi TaxID=360622 RepID=A0AAD8GPQ2_9APIA|nr:hypothetical protein POM88_053856 [Heracleum sosnowskyi]